jgi:AcrR family transcriptional regulator
MTEPGRVYAGRSQDERRADRRQRLVQAGFELFGTEGWAGATIEKLCAAAGVATRSFYEEFASREALLKAVYEDVMAGALAAVVPAVQGRAGSAEERIRTGLGGYIRYVTEDPRRAKVAHREVRAAGVLEQDRHAMILRFAEVIVSQTRLADGEEGRILGLALAGAVAEVLVDWVAQPEPRPETSTMIDTLVRLYVAAVTSPQA